MISRRGGPPIRSLWHAACIPFLPERPYGGMRWQYGVETMASVTYDRTPAARRKSKREQQYASTLVHYLGVDKALAVCKKKMWHGVQQAIIEQQNGARAA